VFPRLRKIINVHGCFWHLHTCRHARVAPAANAAYWQKKRLGNVKRDRRNLAKLRRSGWSVLVLWECQLRDDLKLRRRLTKFLESRRKEARRGGRIREIAIPRAR